MSEKYNIKEISKILNIKASTIRFWEKKNLLSFSKNLNNTYREFGILDLVDLSDLKFFRSLDIPIKKLENFRKINLLEISNLINEGIQINEKKIEKHMKIKEKLLKKQNNIQEIKLLSKKKFIIGDIDIEKVVKFDYTEKEKTEIYIEDSNTYVKYQNSNNLLIEKRGIAVEKNFNDENVLWEKTENKKYIIFLAREYVKLNYKNDIKEKLDEIQKKYKTSIVLGKFLLTALENNHLIDFYKVFVEIVE